MPVRTIFCLYRSKTHLLRIVISLSMAICATRMDVLDHARGAEPTEVASVRRDLRRTDHRAADAHLPWL